MSASPRARMKRNLLVIVLGITFLVLITALGTFITNFVPHRPTAQVQTSQVGAYAITLRVDPNPPSLSQPAMLTISVVQTASRQRVTNARVVVDSDMETMDMGANRVEASADGNGNYVAHVQFSMSGPWQVQVLVTLPGQPIINATFEVMTQ